MVEQEALEKWALNDMWALVFKLPVNYREAIILFAHRQLSMKEMADVLGVTESAVRSRLFRARQKIWSSPVSLSSRGPPAFGKTVDKTVER